MAESNMETTEENVPVMHNEDEHDYEEERRENGDGVSNDTLFLRQLNLIMILSFLSLSHEECLEFQEELEKMEIVREHNNAAAKHSISDLQPRKPRVNEFRVFEGRKAKLQPKVRDCRHCRRM